MTATISDSVDLANDKQIKIKNIFDPPIIEDYFDIVLAGMGATALSPPQIKNRESFLVKAFKSSMALQY